LPHNLLVEACRDEQMPSQATEVANRTKVANRIKVANRRNRLGQSNYLT
jgi:hypothetical protein